VTDRPPEPSVPARIPIIPDHEVLRVIGRGAYGEIWLARSLTGALRAVKVVYRGTFESERAFQREFQGMSSFEPISRAHDGFIDILHVGRTSKYLYYIMELADDHLTGRDIDIINYSPRTLKSDFESRQRLPISDSIALGLSLTDALSALHAQGLTHRDIKPANIIFVDGVPKLADIGLVAVSGQRSFVGTEGYVPPEGPGTPAADIFSLGKVLYEISTGKDRLDFPEVDSQLSQRADRNHALQLNNVLVKACANEPRNRYQSAAAMHDDLVRVQRGETPVRKKWSLVLIWPLVLVSFLVGFGIWRHYYAGTASAVPLQATVRTEPRGAMVALDDYIKPSPATFDDLDPRKYRLRIMLSGYDPIETTIDFSDKRLSTPLVFRMVRSTGALEIGATEPGVAFTIRSKDGEIARAGLTPAKLNDLPTGKYEVSARRGDWELRDMIEIRRAETAHKVFAFLNATLNVTSEPNGADILIDGVSRGKAPLRIDLPARSHEVSARLQGWPEQRQTIEAKTQQDNNVRFVFANGSVKITSAPGGAGVLANGRELGRTPLVIEEVKPGTVRYDLRFAGYKPAVVSGEVVAQQQSFLAARLEKSLSPEPGEAWTNSLGMKFVPLDGVRIAIWETRVQDYDAFCRDTGRRHDPPDFAQGPSHPVVKVNWFDAIAFCKWLTDKEREENVLEPMLIYRLPTDLEWSAAVGLPNEGGGTPEMRDGKIRNEFPWGKQWPPPSGAGNYADQAARRRGTTTIENYNDTFRETSPVGSFKANARGLYDLGGNVWEWCAEGYKGSSSGTGRDWGVLRGGSWSTSNRTELQSSYRNVVDRNDRDVIYGFRCVLAPQADDTSQPR
jgi:serine/threonine protein kinase